MMRGKIKNKMRSKARNVTDMTHMTEKEKERANKKLRQMHATTSVGKTIARVCLNSKTPNAHEQAMDMLGCAFAEHGWQAHFGFLMFCYQSTKTPQEIRYVDYLNNEWRDLKMPNVFRKTLETQRLKAWQNV